MTNPELSRLRDFATRYTAAWCSQDVASVAALFGPTGSLKVNDNPPAVGRQGDGVVYRWTLVGTNTGPDGTGRSVRISGYEEWRIGADGLIQESLGHFDSEDYQRQLDGRQ